ncbi:MAG: hypothetical protein R2688_04205 [Fimbriimonadaceae bacterium]
MPEHEVPLVPDDIYVPNEDLNKYKHDEIVVLVTGSQGEQMAALSQNEPR